MEVSSVEQSHRDPAYKVVWLQSKTGTDTFSASTDGQVNTRPAVCCVVLMHIQSDLHHLFQVLWWDVRKLCKPSERLVLDPGREGNLDRALGGVSLEFEPTMVRHMLPVIESGQGKCAGSGYGQTGTGQGQTELGCD